jgi:lipopolysaccharide transport system permease protein
MPASPTRSPAAAAPGSGFPFLPAVGRHRWDLLVILVQRYLKGLYKNSFLGMVWTILNPLAQLLIYVFLFRIVLALDIPRYSSFAFTGVLVYTWFQTALNDSTSVIHSNADLVAQPGFSPGILPVVSVVTTLINFGIALPLLLLIIALDGASWSLSLAFLPVVMAVQFAFTLGLAYLAAAANVYVRDVQHLMGVGLQLYFFLTPIFYTLDAVPGAYRWVYDINPMAHLVAAYRALLLDGTAPDGMALGLLAVVSAVLLWVGARVFARASHRFLEEL